MSDTPRGPSPVERVQDQAPADRDGRADALAQSGHSRLEDVLVEPLDDNDPQRAAAVCAEITRRLLGDLAAGLVLLDHPTRLRVQALTAFAATLFDFARQSSLEGEKLAQINRWCFDLELALDEQPTGQPVFVLLAAAEREAPWPREALDEVVACARNRAMRPRSRTVRDVARRADELAAALAQALIPSAADALEGIGGALLRARSLLALGDDRRRHQAALAMSELPEAWEGGREPSRQEIESAISRECERLEPLLAESDLSSLPKPWRCAVTYAVLANRRLVARARDAGASLLAAAPALGGFERLLLLWRSRWFPL